MKIIIFGIVASGKTTLAKKMSINYQVPFYEGDCIAWEQRENGRYKRTLQEQQKVIQDIDSLGNWIVEGTYRESQKCLFDMADKIIFLDTPLSTRKRRIIIRFIKQKLHLEKCHYKPNFTMLKLMFQWTYDFEKDRAKYETMLAQYGDKVIQVKLAKQVMNYNFDT
ncbi:MAG: hypothetical protein K0S47_3594 [Herbinix sp.]|jgi:adenylate kinase family enzyme|nr:hypothetical protein [Herbinix sp.]